MSTQNQNPLQYEDELLPILNQNKDFQVSSRTALNNFKQSRKSTQYKPSIFNTLFNMIQSFTHISRLGFASLALFTIIGGGLTAQAFAPEGFKPTDIIVPDQLKVLQSVDCNEFVSVKISDDLSFVKNGLYTESGSTIYIQSNIYKDKIDQGTASESDFANASRSFLIKCYPLDESVSWDEIEKYNLKQPKKSIRYWFGSLYCTKWKHKGVMWTEQYGCVNETKIEKADKSNFNYLTQNSLSKIDDDRFYIKDEDTGFQEERDKKNTYIYEGIQYFIGTKDKKYLRIQLSDSEFFKNKVQIELK
jgi:hypothetical protein